MRSPDDLATSEKPTRSKRRIWAIVALVLVVVLIGSLRSLAGLWTDEMWFASVGQRSVFTTLLSVKIGLLLVFGAIFFLALWANLLVVDRIGATAILIDPEDEMVRRYQIAVRPFAGRIYAAMALVMGVAAGAGTMGQWKNYLLFRHAKSFHSTDPLFGKDIGFYVFKLPFLQFLVSWMLVALIVITIITGIFHYLNGGIHGQRVSPRVRPAVKVHLSVLLALIALFKAAGYFLARYELTTSTNGYVEGATYTDVHARLPAIELLFWISLLAAAILLVNLWRQGWTLPVLAVGLWAFVALIIGVIFPALLQTFKVTPAQSTLEQPYIQRNINGTRAAFGLTKVMQHPFSGSQVPTPSDLRANAETLANIRLWDPDPSISLQTFQKLQGLRSYYQFQSVGIDRYIINKTLTPSVAGVRELNSAGLPVASWVNTHLEYTHGDGMVVAAANTVQPNGNPSFAVSNVPPESTAGLAPITQSSVYFGLSNPGFVVANTKQLELDYQTPAGINVQNHYTGSGGVQLNGFVRRAAFALRLGDLNLLISNLITNTSRIMFVNDVQVMAQKAAPFLSFDSNPYSVLVNGHIDWILDGYTTTDRYPYSQNASNLNVPPGSGLPSSYNYVRSSVKVVINAYSGAMTFYVVDPHDPIIESYQSAFPGLLTPASQMPSDIRAHLRYPQDAFSAQTATYGRYHITSPAAFYNAGDAWTISQTSGAGSPNAALAVTQTVNSQGFVTSTSAQAMSPIYQVNSLPGTTRQTFTITDAYVPASTGSHNQNLSAFMMATSDPDNYGQFNLYVTPSGTNVVGPVIAESEIQQNTKVSSIITPLDQHGSNVLLGNILMIPINQSMLYVRPLYVSSSTNPLPQLKYVISVFNSHVDIETSLTAALSNVLATNVTVPNGGSGGTSSPPVSSSVTSLLAAAAAQYTQAQASLRAGDLAAYQADITQMYTLILQAQSQAQSGQASVTPTTSGSTTTTIPVATSSTTSPPAVTTPQKKASKPTAPSAKVVPAQTALHTGS